MTTKKRLPKLGEKQQVIVDVLRSLGGLISRYALAIALFRDDPPRFGFWHDGHWHLDTHKFYSVLYVKNGALQRGVIRIREDGLLELA